MPSLYLTFFDATCVVCGWISDQIELRQAEIWSQLDRLTLAVAPFVDNVIGGVGNWMQ